MNTSQKGIDLIKSFERCRLKAYKPVPSERYWTIGYGHCGADVKQGMTITQSTADSLFVGDLKPVERVLNGMCISFTQNQFDALTSWIYNLGIGAFKSSIMYKYIVARLKDVEITDQMVRWVNSGGKPLLGLKRRRVAEANMFLGKNLYFVDYSGNIRKH